MNDGNLLKSIDIIGLKLKKENEKTTFFCCFLQSGTFFFCIFGAVELIIHEDIVRTCNN